MFVGVWRRGAALFIDTAILGALANVFARVADVFHPAGFLGYLLLGFAYFVVLERQFGATLGKLLLGIQVVRTDGSSLSWSSAFLRNAFRAVDQVPFMPPFLLGAVLVWRSPRRQRFGDRVAGSAVIKRGTADQLAETDQPAPLGRVRVLVGGAFMVSLLVAGGVFTFRISSELQPVVEAGDAFLTALQQGQSLLSLSSPGFRLAVGSDESRKLMDTGGQPTAWVFTSREMFGDEARLRGKVTFVGGSQRPFELVLAKTGGTWRVIVFYVE